MKLLLLTLPLLAAAKPLREKAPLHAAQNGAHIADSYLIKFKDHLTQSLAVEHYNWVQDVHDSSMLLAKRSQMPMSDAFSGLKHIYNMQGLMGYSGHFDESVIDQVRMHPDVELVERDQEVHVLSHPHEDNSTTEKNAPWGLARLSHRKGLTFGTFNKYLYSADGGEGVDIYIIDTGTNIEHVDFEGRAKWGKTIPTGDEDLDGNGHGTHCSGTAAGKKYGVAKKANVIGIKVLRSSGSGSMSDVVKGVEYAAVSHSKEVSKAKDGKRKGFRGSTANMSLGGGTSKILDQAVNAAVRVGIHFAVAAGNDNADSCNYSPAAAERAVTVGASTLADERAYFSNYGKCNDIFAPGLNIQSTWIGSKYAVNTISGTSMASPHIAGLLAYMLSLQPAHDSGYAVATITPQELKANLLAIATRNALTGVPSDTANILAWNGGGSSNYTEIVSQGAFDVKTASAQTVQPKSGVVGHTVSLDKLIEAADKVIDEMKAIKAQALSA